MKSVKETLLERRSIRRYERQPIEQEKMEFIYQAIRNTPTSYNGQQFSVIEISDQSVKEQLYEITGQKQIKTSAVFLVFCLDFHKLRVAARLKGVESPAFEATIDGYTVGVIDASLAMMSALIAAESMGLGGCCVGYIRTADPVKVSEMLGLPEGVAIVCGLAIGYPREMPDLKPKLPQPLVIHKNHYTLDAEMEPLLCAYDKEVYEYNRHRAGDQTENDWAEHIVWYHKHSMEHGIREYLKKQIDLEF
ncbi:MAG TPA: nitroreductase family protein [Candidatus Alistipes merdigallinarum]|nr:nitroreductase family protein [Candidatus Alistipes merdigallinarum]